MLVLFIIPQCAELDLAPLFSAVTTTPPSSTVTPTTPVVYPCQDVDAMSDPYIIPLNNIDVVPLAANTTLEDVLNGPGRDDLLDGLRLVLVNDK